MTALAGTVCTTLAIFAFAPSAVLASATHPPIGTFGLNGGHFYEDDAIAIDESTGSVYVYDEKLKTIFKFTADGAPSGFSALKSNGIHNLQGGAVESPGLAVDNSSGPAKGDIYFANRFQLYIFGPDGGSLGEFATAKETHNHIPAVPCGVSVGPSGDVYLSETTQPVAAVDRYGPTHNPFTSSDYLDSLYLPSNDGRTCTTAIDSVGDLYAITGNKLESYGALDFNVLEEPATGTLLAELSSEEHFDSLAVDRSDNSVYAVQRGDLYGTSHVFQYSAAGVPIAKFGESELGNLMTNENKVSQAVGVNSSTGRIYVAEDNGLVHMYGGQLVVQPDPKLSKVTAVQPTGATLNGTVNPSGVPVTECVFEYGPTTQIEVDLGRYTFDKSVPCSQNPGSGNSEVAVSASLTGLKENTMYDYRLKVANAEVGNVTEPPFPSFTTTTATGPPTAEPSVSGITRTEAVLGGVIDPNGSDTTYHFEYGKDTSYGTSLPVPDTNAGAGTSQQQLAPVTIGGLEAGTVYHYRLEAVNALGTLITPDGTFETEPAAVISHASSREVRSTTAALRAEINPLGSSTSYRFEYGPTTDYGSVLPVPDGTVSAAFGRQPALVAVQLGSLEPGTNYHFRVVASNVYGTVTGPDHTFTTFEEPSATVGADTCPNAAYRVRFSTSLPDCRAFEMVSPVNKSGADVVASYPQNFVISHNGNHVDYMTRTGMGETQGSGNGGFSQFLAIRGADGWSSHGVYPTPALNEPAQAFVKGTELLAYDEQLEKAVVETYSLPGVTGAVPNSVNLYMEDMSTLGIVEPVTKLEAPEAEGSQLMWVQGYTPDLSAVTFETPINLVPPANGKEYKYYAFRNGKVELIGYLPDGSFPPAGALPPRTIKESLKSRLQLDTVSRDGSRMPFVSPVSGSESQLYLQRYGMASAWVSEPETSGPKFVPHDIHFQTMTPDGKRVLFTSPEPLTKSAVGSEGVGLYMYTDGPNPESESNLTFIGLVGSLGAKKDAVEVVYGVSGDGSHVYFDSAKGVELWDKGQVHVITAGQNVGEESYAWTSISPLGTQFAFTAAGSHITSREVEIKDSTITNKTEIYLYDESSDTVSCVSCPPSGATPTSGVELLPRGTNPSNPEGALSGITRNVAWEGGFIFFNTSESLVPQDTNGIADAYEYNVKTGKLSLLSPGTGENGSWFVQTNPSGSDALVATREQLTGWDEDKLDDVYDARINGGYP
ncbi:MAG TPA: hypothetical protein VGY30_04030, partial [Solirubrobacteraceae bacterium]|nr:hypothetical protein [Solirubrobacteraceae bacterium]